MTSKKRYRTVVVAGFLGAILIGLGACVPLVTQLPMIAMPDNQSARLVDAHREPIEVRSSLDIPFSLTNVPQKAELQFDFRVDSKGVCPADYRATTFSINKKLIGELNFRTSYTRGQHVSYSVILPSGILEVGDNLLHVKMGSCMEAIDAMRLNNITLLQ